MPHDTVYAHKTRFPNLYLIYWKTCIHMQLFTVLCPFCCSISSVGCLFIRTTTIQKYTMNIPNTTILAEHYTILYICCQKHPYPLLTCWFGQWAPGPLWVAGTGLSRDKAPRWAWGCGPWAEPGPPSEGPPYPRWPRAGPPGSSPGWLPQPVPSKKIILYYTAPTKDHMVH